MRTRSPIEFEPVPEDGILTFRIPKLGVDVFSESIDGLKAGLEEQILMLWEEYAAERDDRLTPAARLLKSALLNAFVEKPNAAASPPG